MNKKTSLYLSISVFIILILRFVLTAIVPLLDKTEARYSEIARLMSETGEWVVLQIDYGIPFWAKPPLSTWLSALSFEIFGVNEMAARLPSFLIAIGIILLVGRFAKKSGVSFYMPAFILLTMPEFLIHTGVVSTDSTLGLSVVLVMLSFWESMNSDKNSIWNYLFFVGVGLGLLAKGPIIIILTGPPIFIWCLLGKNRFKDLFTKLPWLIGILITALITLPWYYLVEQRSPGFIDYFIVGEHFKRFIEPGWSGDLYGSGHSQPKGMIWLFLLAFAFPWVQVVFYKLWKYRKTILKNRWVSYLMFWMLWTPLFFTISSNILHTYIVPVLVPIALLMVYWWKDYQHKKRLIIVGSIFPAFVVIAFVAFFTGKFDDSMNSNKYLIEHAQNIDATANEIPIYYLWQKSYSGQFYTSGKAQFVNDERELDSVSKIHDKLFLVVQKRSPIKIPKDKESDYILLKSNYKTSIYLMAKNP